MCGKYHSSSLFVNIDYMFEQSKRGNYNCVASYLYPDLGIGMKLRCN